MREDAISHEVVAHLESESQARWFAFDASERTAATGSTISPRPVPTLGRYGDTPARFQTVNMEDTMSEEAKNAIWRCGVGTGIEAADRIMALMYKSRSKAVRDFADQLDGIMQLVADEKNKNCGISTYSDAFDLHKSIQLKVASAIEARRAETLGPVHESASDAK